MEKFIVFENWGFGVNYYDKAGRVIPDYKIKDNNFPTMSKKTALNIAERGQYRHIKKA